MTEQAPPPAPADGSSPHAPLAGDGGAGIGSPGGLDEQPSAGSPTTSAGPYRTAAAPPALAGKPSYAFLIGVSLVTLVADLGSKSWAKGRLDDAKTWTERHIEVVKGVWSFIFAKNRGGAWGLLQDEPESIRRPFFLGISVLAIIFIVSLYRKLTPQQWALKWGLPLVLGGALGNLVNRIQYNYVVDFIDFQYKGHHWPTFNVADIAIVVGVGLMAIDMFTPRRALPQPAVAVSVPAVDGSRDPALFPPDPIPVAMGETPKPPAQPVAEGEAAPRES